MIVTRQGAFLGVDRRVVLYRPSLELPPPRPTRLQLIKLLTTHGFGHVDAPVYDFAREVIGKPFQRGALMADAPNAFTCSTLVKYVYARRGIWVPRSVIQQYASGRPVESLKGGDLVFRSATDGSEEPYHIGIVTNNRTVIHTAGRGDKPGVKELPLASFRRASRYLGGRRIVHDWDEIDTFITPTGTEIETSDDLNLVIRRIVLGSK